MLFNSIDFFIFFAIVFGLYLVLPLRGQNLLLLVASYFFYGYWDYRFLSLLLISTVIDYWAGLGIHGTDSSRKKKLYLLASMCSNLGLLGFFKYFNFFVDSAQHALSGLGLAVPAWRLNIILPVGISFYTFQTMSYTIDIYRGQMAPTRSFVNFATFVAFFPQLVAGPIERASHLLPQVERKRTVTWQRIQEGAWLILWGLFKKAVIADNLATIVQKVFGGEVPLTAGAVLVGLYAFAFQIYCDFSAYSDMARGLAGWMGFDIMVNFNNPYLAVNPSDFWRRWHISLSTWLRDYLYIPLGGNKKGVRRTYINLALTMLLGGLWHGAAWTFVVWGAYQGLLLIVHRLFAGRGGSEVRTWGFSRWWRMILMFHLACYSWLLFRAQSMGQVWEMMTAFVRNPVLGEETGSWLAVIVVLCLPLWIVQLLQEKTGDLLAPLRLSLFPRTVLMFVCLLMLWCLGNTGGQAFIYFQF